MTVRSVTSDSTSRGSSTPRLPTSMSYRIGYLPVWPPGPRCNAAASIGGVRPMARVNVIDPETRELVGWFDDEKAERFAEDRDWNGSNWISVATGSQWHHEELYRTAGGRW